VVDCQAGSAFFLPDALGAHEKKLIILRLLVFAPIFVASLEFSALAMSLCDTPCYAQK